MPDHPDLFAGPIEQAHVRALAVPADPAPAQRALDQTIAHHEKVRREWLDRVRRAMVELYRAREQKNQEEYHGTLTVAVTADDASAFLERVGYEGSETRWLANVFVGKNLWHRGATIPSARRHGSRIPCWHLNEDVATRLGF